ncbi:MAG: DUF2149 domain-containing protein [Thermoleophilia bacterium]
MAAGIDKNVSSPPPEDSSPAPLALRYMHRRRVSRIDRNGDPLDGVVNLFDVAIVLALGFLLAALSGFGLSDLLSSHSMTIVKNPGTASMQVIVKQGNQVKTLNLKASEKVTGAGTLIGQFYRLQDGTTIYVPASGATSNGSNVAPAGGAATSAPASTAGSGAAPASTVTPSP